MLGDSISQYGKDLRHLSTGMGLKEGRLVVQKLCNGSSYGIIHNETGWLSAFDEADLCQRRQIRDGADSGKTVRLHPISAVYQCRWDRQQMTTT